MRGIVGLMGRDALTGSDREMPFSGRGVAGGYGGVKQRWWPVPASSRVNPLPQGPVQASRLAPNPVGAGLPAKGPVQVVRERLSGWR
ncbi:hypothetical protein B8W72_17145 [Pseudomonas putida]|uniref:Uncharacterized protein n=1 Tax=Pseudomonas putida TaxID=303 RepID=A0A1Y3L5L7_PSEPU|nr:hypothetical protein B8W72_17145 [Pseudomonas putida]RZI91567.1 MAG: hypothetical protein EOP15_00650 [Pseudomonas sp.]